MAKEKSKPVEHVWARLLILSCLILVINSWSLHHLGSDVTQLSIANAPLAFIAIVSFFAQILKKQETSQIAGKMRGWFFFFLKTPVLVILSALILAAGSFVSSLTVMSGGALDKAEVKLTPEGQSGTGNRCKLLSGPNGIVRFVRLTTPFGSPFYLEVEGYLRHSFDLYPWIGENIRVAKDLRVSPSILIRVPTAAHKFLGIGKLVVVSGDKEIAEAKTDPGRASVLLGRNLPIPNQFVERWERELIAQSVVGPAAARSLLAWQYPLVVRLGQPLVPGTTLEAKLVMPSGTVKARAKFKVGSDEIQDVLMIKEV